MALRTAILGVHAGRRRRVARPSDVGVAGLGKTRGVEAGLAGGTASGRPGGRAGVQTPTVGREQGGGNVEDEDRGKLVNTEKFRVPI